MDWTPMRIVMKSAAVTDRNPANRAEFQCDGVPNMAGVVAAVHDTHHDPAPGFGDYVKDHLALLSDSSKGTIARESGEYCAILIENPDISLGSFLYA
jgi:hypothetical protein